MSEKTTKEMEKLKDDIRYVMEDERGRRYIYRLLTQCGLYKSIASSGFKTNEAFIQMGRREQGLQLLAEVSNYAPGSYQLMVKENSNG